MAVLATQYPVYQPAMRIVSNITNASRAIVTTTFAHQYLTGTICRLHIPTGYGMLQANTLYGPITVTGTTTFTIDIDTTFFDPYITHSDWPYTAQYPTVVPIGELNSQLTASVRNVLPYSAT